MTIFGKEPALVIGTIVTILLAIVSTLAGNGFISDVAAGKLTDLVNGAAQLVLLLIPLITAALIRTQVTPANPPSA
jgi:hypothetical protein